MDKFVTVTAKNPDNPDDVRSAEIMEQLANSPDFLKHYGDYLCRYIMYGELPTRPPAPPIPEADSPA